MHKAKKQQMEMFLVSLGYQAQEGRMCRNLKGQKMVFSWFEDCIGFEGSVSQQVQESS